VILIWAANATLLASVWLLGRKSFKLGWAANLLGDLMYTYASLYLMQPRHWDIASFNITIACFAAWNLWKTYTTS
jgi:hypothetical protein